jgi:hypothetical protein
MRFLYKFGRVIAFLGLFYQIISVTISYLEYEAVIDMKASFIRQKIVLTFCLYSGNEFPKKFKSLEFEILSNQSFVCVLGSTYGKQQIIECTKLSKVVESVTPFSRRCLSLFSHLLDKNFLPNDSVLTVLFDNKIKIYALIHQIRTPPHFIRNKIEMIDSRANRVDISSINTKLLPFPHSTDCFDYTRDKELVNGFKSREDCIVKHLERKEFDECGCNKRWFYKEFGSRNYSNICDKFVKCDFDSKSQINSLEKICKNNCYNEHYIDLITDSSYEKIYKDLDIK